MNTHRWCAGLLALVGLIGLAVVGAVPAWAADCGDTAGPGGTDVPCSCGDTVVTTTVLDAATDPVVSTSPADTCPGDGLLIGADGITLDLRGNTIRGVTGAGVLVAGRSGVTVRRGRIEGFTRGIFLDGVPAPVTGNLIATNVMTDNSSGIHMSFASGDAATGVPGNQVSGNTVSGSGRAILMEDSDENIVEKNTIKGNFLGIQLIGGARNIVRNNQTSDNGDDGILLNTCGGGNTLKANRLLRNQGHGLITDPCGAPTGDTFELNIADGNASDGMLIRSDGNAVVGNRGKLNGGDGLRITGTGSDVDKNVFDQNAGWGICVAPGNFDSGGNRASRNGSGNISWVCP